MTRAEAIKELEVLQIFDNSYLTKAVKLGIYALRNMQGEAIWFECLNCKKDFASSSVSGICHWCGNGGREVVNFIDK